jgi:hypothetical protein
MRPLCEKSVTIARRAQNRAMARFDELARRIAGHDPHGRCNSVTASGRFLTTGGEPTRDMDRDAVEPLDDADALLDLDIRAALHRRLDAQHGKDPKALVVDELALCQGEARVDVAAVNGRLEGYEIKGPRDSLARLPGQRDAYNRVFDRMTIVCADRHASAIEKLVPAWWGLWGVVVRRNEISLTQVRRPRANPAIESLAVAQLLWRGEALALLAQHGIADGLRSKPKRELWSALAKGLPLTALRRGVREAIGARGDWRSERPRLSSGGSSQPLAKL